MQLTFARSLDPIVPIDLSITRQAVTKPEDATVVISEESGKGAGGKQTEMGRKSFVPYGLYRAHGFFNPHFAAQTCVSEEDLGLFWQALTMMWDHDRSSSRGQMQCRGLYIFTHENRLGNAPAHTLFERIDVQRKDGVQAPRKFSDYAVAIDADNLPTGVTLTTLVG